jgi:hypothetical protein
MLGFVISGKIELIIENLKAAVGNIHYNSESEKLHNEKCIGWNHSFQSQHKRVNHTKIHIYHLLFEFSGNYR